MRMLLLLGFLFTACDDNQNVPEDMSDPVVGRACGAGNFCPCGYFCPNGTCERSDIVSATCDM